MARLQDLLNQSGYISMDELDAIEAAQLGQQIGQIPGSFGPGQGSFRGSGGNLVNLTQQGWQDTGTGEVIAPSSGGQDYQLDYASPLEVMGRKGYRIKGDSSRALMSDGSMVNLNAGDVAAQQAARQKAEAAALDMDIKRADLAGKQGGGWKYDKDAGGFVNDRGEFKPMSGSGGKSMTKPDQWKYDSGSDTWVSPPSAENPEGKVTIPASRANAAKSMDYVAEQFAPVLEKTPQGGFMGLQGTIGQVTNSQEARRFNNLKEQLSTELRTLFRIPGEGALSDKEQAQYGVQLPDVKNDAETNKQILRDIQNRAQIRVGGQSPATRQPAAPSAGGNAVALPDGRIKTFPSAAAAEAFRRAAGL